MEKIEFTQEQKKKIVILYDKELLDAEKIGTMFNCSYGPVYRILREEGIKIDGPSRKKLLYRNNKIRRHNKKEFSKEQIKKIIDLYIKELKNSKEIGMVFNVGESFILNILKLNNINISQSHRRKLLFLNNKIISPQKGKNKYNCEALMRLSNRLKGRPITWKDKLRKPHGAMPQKIKDKISLAHKGKKLTEQHKINIGFANRGKTRRGHNWSVNSREKLRLKRIGKNNPMYGKKRELAPRWLSGKSSEPYGLEFDEVLRYEIRKRDNFVCQECWLTEDDLIFREKSKYNHTLRIHHIDYNKQNNSKLNLISLCIKCHIKTNNNRIHWKNYFKMKMFIKELFNPQNIVAFENNKLIGLIQK